MLNVTDQAAQELNEVREHNDVPPENCLRLLITPGGQFGFGVDAEKQGDQVVHCGETKVLLIGRDLSVKLEGKRLDVQQTEQGAEFFVGPSTP
ncbi:MAG: hypothetical protein ACE5JS_08200 [Nitrospinota bacterium]